MQASVLNLYPNEKMRVFSGDNRFGGSPLDFRFPKFSGRVFAEIRKCAFASQRRNDALKAQNIQAQGETLGLHVMPLQGYSKSVTIRVFYFLATSLICFSKKGSREIPVSKYRTTRFSIDPTL
jgi:hypothetical protein